MEKSERTGGDSDTEHVTKTKKNMMTGGRQPLGQVILEIYLKK